MREIKPEPLAFLNSCNGFCKTQKCRNGCAGVYHSQVDNCKSNCASWFPYSASLMAGCQAACDAGKQPDTKEEYIDNFVSKDIAQNYYGSIPTNQKDTPVSSTGKWVLSGVGLIILLLILIVIFF